MIARLALALVLLPVAACAQTDNRYQPPPAYNSGAGIGGNARYEQDLAQCRHVAEQQGTPVRDTATGALVGAAVGAAGGALVGGVAKGVSAGTGAAVGAAGGALVGGGYQASKSYDQQKQIVNDCMRRRGWNVVN